MTKEYLLVGTYTNQNQSKGFYIFEVDFKKQKIEQLHCVEADNPSFLEWKQPYLFAVHEADDKGLISSYYWDQRLNTVQKISTLQLPGGASCHLKLWQDYHHIAVANYAAGIFAVCAIDENGVLTKITDVKENTGCGPLKERQAGAHAHSLTQDQSGKYFIGADLGGDTLYIYEADPHLGRLVPNQNQTHLKVSPGEGPRHLTFHGNNRFLYLITELQNNIIAFAFDESKGAITEIQKLSLLPNEEELCYGADLHISSDGRFLYASVRGYDQLCVYEIDQENGLLSHIEDVTCHGCWPRNFCFTKDEQFLFIANQNSNNIVLCERNKDSGRIGQKLCEIKIDQPVFVKTIQVLADQR